MKLEKIKKIVDTNGIGSDSSDIDREYMSLSIQFRIVLIVVFLIHSINNFSFGQIPVGVILILLSVLSVLTFYFTQLMKNNFFLLFVFIILIGIIFFFESYAGFRAGCTLYYLPIFFGAPFVFMPPKEMKYISIVLIIIVISISVNFATGYTLFTNPHLPEGSILTTLILSVASSSLLIVLELILIVRKNRIINGLYGKQASIEAHKEVSDLEKMVDLAKNNYASFFTSFTELYPNFSNNMLSVNPSLTVNDIEICALIKLGFSTKEIAQHTRLSIRAIEGRKYRIGKKIGIPSDKELVILLMNTPYK